MPYTVGIASDYINLQQRLRKFLTGDPLIENEVEDPGNSGSGFMRGLMTKPAAVNETWTLTCTGAGPNATFSTSGSVSGSDGTITSTHSTDTSGGNLFSGTYFELEMIDGTNAFQIGDFFTFDVVTNGLVTATQTWTELKWAPGNQILDKPMELSVVGDAKYAHELYLKGTGLAGADEVHVNLYVYMDPVGDYYNWGMKGAAGFDTDDDFDAQPGGSNRIGMSLWQFQIPYWFVADGRRMLVSAKISTNYMHMYAGLFLPYATPAEYPYPAYVGGPHSGTAIRWSSESHNHRSWWDPNVGYVYTIEGLWLQVQNKKDLNGGESLVTSTNIWPYSNNIMAGTRQSPGDVYPMLPMVIHTDQNGGNVYGELPGGFWCPGFANASENVIVVSSVDYVVMQDVYRTSNADYFALKLE